MARYYDIDGANDRLRELRPLLERLRADRDAVAEAQRDLVRFRETNGNAGHADELATRESAIRNTVKRMQLAVAQIDGWGITLRDIDSGLVDFPALANGRPIWLCWRFGEDDIGWWHELESGFASRKRLAELS